MNITFNSAPFSGKVDNSPSLLVGGLNYERKKIRGPRPLSDGSPCINHGCVLCCKDTEMPLTSLDINRLMKMGFKVKDFVQEVDGESRLKNKNNTCYFLSENLCIAYNVRPKGCRLYPLIFDVDNRIFVFDEFCPFKEEFTFTKNDLNDLKALLRRIDRDSIKNTKGRL